MKAINVFTPAPSGTTGDPALCANLIKMLLEKYGDSVIINMCIVPSIDPTSNNLKRYISLFDSMPTNVNLKIYDNVTPQDRFPACNYSFAYPVPWLIDERCWENIIQCTDDVSNIMLGTNNNPSKDDLKSLMNRKIYKNAPNAKMFMCGLSQGNKKEQDLLELENLPQILDTEGQIQVSGLLFDFSSLSSTTRDQISNIKNNNYHKVLKEQNSDLFNMIFNTSNTEVAKSTPIYFSYTNLIKDADISVFDPKSFLELAVLDSKDTEPPVIIMRAHNNNKDSDPNQSIEALTKDLINDYQITFRYKDPSGNIKEMELGNPDGQKLTIVNPFGVKQNEMLLLNLISESITMLTGNLSFFEAIAMNKFPFYQITEWSVNFYNSFINEVKACATNSGTSSVYAELLELCHPSNKTVDIETLHQLILNNREHLANEAKTLCAWLGKHYNQNGVERILSAILPDDLKRYADIDELEYSNSSEKNSDVEDIEDSLEASRLDIDTQDDFSSESYKKIHKTLTDLEESAPGQTVLDLEHITHNIQDIIQRISSDSEVQYAQKYNMSSSSTSTSTSTSTSSSTSSISSTSLSSSLSTSEFGEPQTSSGEKNPITEESDIFFSENRIANESNDRNDSVPNTNQNSFMATLDGNSLKNEEILLIRGIIRYLSSHSEVLNDIHSFHLEQIFERLFSNRLLMTLLRNHLYGDFKELSKLHSVLSQKFPERIKVDASPMIFDPSTQKLVSEQIMLLDSSFSCDFISEQINFIFTHPSNFRLPHEKQYLQVWLSELLPSKSFVNLLEQRRQAHISTGANMINPDMFSLLMQDHQDEFIPNLSKHDAELIISSLSKEYATIDRSSGNLIPEFGNLDEEIRTFIRHADILITNKSLSLSTEKEVCKIVCSVIGNAQQAYKNNQNPYDNCFFLKEVLKLLEVVNTMSENKDPKNINSRYIKNVLKTIKPIQAIAESRLDKISFNDDDARNEYSDLLKELLKSNEKLKTIHHISKKEKRGVVNPLISLGLYKPESKLSIQASENVPSDKHKQKMKKRKK